MKLYNKKPRDIKLLDKPFYCTIDTRLEQVEASQNINVKLQAKSNCFRVFVFKLFENFLASENRYCPFLSYDN